MKKLLSYILVLAMLFACGALGAFAEDSEAIEFTPTLIGAADVTAEQWVSDPEFRALATILIAFDITMAVGQESDQAPDFAKPTYIGRDEEDLVLYMHSDAQDILALYRPGANLGSYTLMDVMSDDIALSVLQESCANGCYENEPATVLSVANQIQQTIEESESGEG